MEFFRKPTIKHLLPPTLPTKPRLLIFLGVALTNAVIQKFLEYPSTSAPQIDPKNKVVKPRL